MNLSTDAIDAMLNALAADLNNGYLDVYGHASGSASSTGAPPPSADTAITTQALLASHRFSATAFGAAAAKQIIANAITSAVIGATGVARFARLFKSDHTSVRADLTIGACTITTSAAAAKGATTLTVNGLTAPVYNGDRFLASGNKVVTVTADAAINATAITVAALADAIAAGETLGYDLLWNSAQLVTGVTDAVAGLTLSLPNGL